MSRILADESAVRILASNDLPAEAGGGKNPFQEQILFLNSTRGAWNHQNETKGGRASFEEIISQNCGRIPDRQEVGPLYISPYFNPAELSIESIEQATILFTALGFYFEVVEYAAYLTIADQQYDNQTPSYLPKSRLTVVGEDGSETVVKVKWHDWKAYNQPGSHYSKDGLNFIQSHATGRLLCSSLLMELKSDGYVVSAGHIPREHPEAEGL